MHVRVAWEIYHHQQKSGEAKGSLASATAAAKTSADLLRPPTHLFSPSVHARPPHELSPFQMSLANHRPPGFDQPHHPGSLFTSPAGHLGKYAISIFFFFNLQEDFFQNIPFYCYSLSSHSLPGTGFVFAYSWVKEMYCFIPVLQACLDFSRI